MYCDCYLRSGIFYVPTLHQIERQHLLVLGPVVSVPAGDVNGLRDALVAAIRRGNPVIPPPARDYPGDDVPRAAGLKSWRAFDRGAEYWSIDEQSGVFKIEKRSRAPKGNWPCVRENVVSSSPGLSVEAGAEWLVGYIRRTMTTA
jgi:hypothetical protein